MVVAFRLTTNNFQKFTYIVIDSVIPFRDEFSFIAISYESVAFSP